MNKLFLIDQLRRLGSKAELDENIEGGVVHIEIDPKIKETLSTFMKAKEAYRVADSASPSWMLSKLDGIPYIQPPQSSLDIVVLSHSRTTPLERDKIVEDMDRAGYRPLEFSELLALGVIKPELNKRNEYLVTYKKYTLGDKVQVTYLRWYGDERWCDAIGVLFGWSDRNRFLFTEK